MKVMIAVIVTDRRKVIVKVNATAAPVDSESDEHFSVLKYKINYVINVTNIFNQSQLYSLMTIYFRD